MLNGAPPLPDMYFYQQPPRPTPFEHRDAQSLNRRLLIFRPATRADVDGGISLALPAAAGLVSRLRSVWRRIAPRMAMISDFSVVLFVELGIGIHTQSAREVSMPWRAVHERP